MRFLDGESFVFFRTETFSLFKKQNAGSINVFATAKHVIIRTKSHRTADNFICILLSLD